MRWDERIGRRLRLRDLHILQAVAEAGTMVKAAERLAVSQPAVSKAISDLEHTLGVPVLDRTARGVELTGYGRALLRHAPAVFDSLRQGIEEVQHLRDPTRGELRIGVPEPIANVLSAIIDEHLAELPDVRIQVTVGDTAMLLDALRDRRLDTALTRLPELDDAGDLDIRVLFNDPLIIAAGPGNRWTGRGTIDLAQLSNEKWVLPPPGTVLGRFAAEIFRSRGLFPPRACIEAGSLHLRLSLLSLGGYLSLLPKAMLSVQDGSQRIAALPIDLPETERPVGLVQVKGRSQSPLCAAFCERAAATTRRILKDQ